MMEFSLKKCLKDPKQMDQFNFSELNVQQITFGNSSSVDLLKQSNQAKMFEASSQDIYQSLCVALMFVRIVFVVHVGQWCKECHTENFSNEFSVKRALYQLSQNLIIRCLKVPNISDQYYQFLFQQNQYVQLRRE